MLDDGVSKALEDFDLSRGTISRLELFVRLVQESPMNLTAFRGNDLWIRGVLDSLAILRGVEPYRRALDIGTGGGFPGVVLAICYPEREWVFLESRKKRAQFLVDTCYRLDLKRVRVIASRAEEFIRLEGEARGAFDLVTARAVGPVRKVVELGLPFLRSGGQMAVPQGPDGPSRFHALSSWVSSLGGTVEAEIPGAFESVAGSPDWIMIVRKTGATSSMYPRIGRLLGSQE